MRRALTAAVAVALLSVAACGSSSSRSESEREREEHKDRAADTSTCLAQAKPYDAALPANYPRSFPLPGGAVLFDVEDRGSDGAIGTAIVKATLKEVLAALNGPAQEAGFKVTEGETETHDAEANWEGNGYRGRWAIRDSAKCQGEVVIQVLAKKQS